MAHPVAQVHLLSTKTKPKKLSFDAWSRWTRTLSPTKHHWLNMIRTRFLYDMGLPHLPLQPCVQMAWLQGVQSFPSPFRATAFPSPCPVALAPACASHPLRGGAGWHLAQLPPQGQRRFALGWPNHAALADGFWDHSMSASVEPGGSSPCTVPDRPDSPKSPPSGCLGGRSSEE